jgi:hypothetical protein
LKERQIKAIVPHPPGFAGQKPLAHFQVRLARTETPDAKLLTSPADTMADCFPLRTISERELNS